MAGMDLFGHELRVLVLGEKDFSFSACLRSLAAGTIVSTTNESKGSLREKYPGVSDHLHGLNQKGTALLHNVDPTQLLKTLLNRKCLRYDRVVTNFPHIGVASGGGAEKTRRLLKGIFDSVPDVITEGGRLYISLWRGYTKSSEVDQARGRIRHAKWRLVRVTPFEWERYPTYKHQNALPAGETADPREADTYE